MPKPKKKHQPNKTAVCAYCEKERPLTAIKHEDPYCSALCCHKDHDIKHIDYAKITGIGRTGYVDHPKNKKPGSKVPAESTESRDVELA